MKLLPGKITAVAPLLLNGYALVFNVGATAVLGVVFWIVATRLYSQEQVGIAAALISAMMTISYFAQLNLSSFLTRFIPEARSGAWQLITKIYLLTGVLSAIAAMAFAAGIGFIAEPLAVVRDDIGLLLLFVVTTVLWTIFSLQNAALSGLRRATIVPVSNTIYAVAKIALLFVPAAFWLSSDQGIFFAWSIPLLPIVVVVNMLISRGLGSLMPEPAERDIDLRSASRFWGWDFIGSLAVGAAVGVAPLMITASVGVEATAAYHLAWSAAYSIYLVGLAMSTSLVAEGSADMTRLRQLIVESLSHALFLVSGIVVFTVIFASQLMALFGPDYIEQGGPTLRLLALSCLPWSVTTIYCAVSRVRRKTRNVAIVQIGTLIIFLSVSALLLADFGAQGVAVGWLVAHSTIFACVIIRVVVLEGWSGFVDWIVALMSSARRLSLLLPPSFSRKVKAQTIPPDVIAALGHSSLKAMAPLRVKGSQTDVAVLLCGAKNAMGEASVVLKFSTTENGIAALRRNSSALKTIGADPRLGPHAELLPKILLEDSWGDCFCTVETLVQGTDGRAIMKKADLTSTSMAAVVSVLADIHRRTATAREIDEAWARKWIDAPIAQVASARRRRGGDKSEALAWLRAELRRTFVGREALLGVAHGDLCLGNLFFIVDENNSEDNKLRLSGLIDWDTCRYDAPAAIDACQFGLSARMEQNGEEFGLVVRDLLRDGQWSEKESAIFCAAGLQAEFGPDSDPRLRRGFLLLTWLHHVATVIGQTKNGNWRRFWTAANVDLVLAALPCEPHQEAG